MLCQRPMLTTRSHKRGPMCDGHRNLAHLMQRGRTDRQARRSPKGAFTGAPWHKHVYAADHLCWTIPIATHYNLKEACSPSQPCMEVSMSFGPLDDEEEKATKYLGEKAKFPPQKVDIKALADVQTKAYEAFQKARDEMGPLLAECEKANDGIIFGLKQMGDAYEKSDFGLDSKTKNDAKNIKQAQKQFMTFFDGLVKELENVNKSKYKSPKPTK